MQGNCNFFVLMLKCNFRFLLFFSPIQFFQVMVDQHGFSKGSGFVAFSMPEEATRAVSFYCSVSENSLEPPPPCQLFVLSHQCINYC